MGYQIQVGYQTGMVGYQTGGGKPDAGGGIPDASDGIPNASGIPPHGMMGYQTGDDGVPGRDRVTTLMSHQSEILHSLIFCSFLKLYKDQRIYFIVFNLSFQISPLLFSHMKSEYIHLVIWRLFVLLCIRYCRHVSSHSCYSCGHEGIFTFRTTKLFLASLKLPISTRADSLTCMQSALHVPLPLSKFFMIYPSRFFDM